MIITLKGANFSANNIGTLSTWTISRVLGNGATYSGASYVDKGAALNATVTISDGYEIGAAGVSVTMGGSAVTNGITISGNTVTIAIASVTGNVVIKVPTKTIGGEEEPETPPSDGSGDVTLTLADYKSYLGCIAGSTNTIQGTGTAGTTDNGNMYVQIPLQDFSNPSSVTITAETSTKAYFAFFSRKIISSDNGQTPPYVSGITAQTILSEGASNTATIPSGATHMYILLTNGSGGSLRPKSVVFHNATYVSNSDPANGASDGGTSGGTQTTEKVFDVYWTLGYTINSAGSLGAQPTYAVSDIITVPSGKQLKYTPYSGEQIWMVIGLWNEDTWIERKTFDPATVTSATTIDLGAATKIRIGYGRASSSNINMDLTSLKHLQLEWV